MTKRWWVLGSVMVMLIVGLGVAVTRARTTAQVPAPATWATRTDAVTRALASGDLSAAIYSWRDAYGEALRSRRWEALIAVGDAAVQIDRALGDWRSFRPEARRVYLEALFRARAAGAIVGIQHVARAFAELGDTEMSARASEMAQTLTGRQAER